MNVVSGQQLKRYVYIKDFIANVGGFGEGNTSIDSVGVVLFAGDADVNRLGAIQNDLQGVGACIIADGGVQFLPVGIKDGQASDESRLARIAWCRDEFQNAGLSDDDFDQVHIVRARKKFGACLVIAASLGQHVFAQRDLPGDRGVANLDRRTW